MTVSLDVGDTKQITTVLQVPVKKCIMYMVVELLSTVHNV